VQLVRITYELQNKATTIVSKRINNELRWWFARIENSCDIMKLLPGSYQTVNAENCHASASFRRLTDDGE
jgi:hypothetical protein